MVNGVTILGSTGTIGVNTLDVISRHHDRYRVVALAAHRNVDALLAQCRVWRPAYAALADERSADTLRSQLRSEGLATEVLGGARAIETVVALPEAQSVMAAIVGAAGLLPTLAAARAGKRVLLANKEALVMSGRLFMEAVRQNGATLLPIDSEHNALFQCMPTGFEQGLERMGVRRILLTGSGGPFRCTPPQELAAVTPEQACAHPNWVMGRKISVDSATMMNKGLEIIEACWLFNTTQDKIQVVIHPQSIIHSMVEYADGSVLAQLGNPDMRTPIAHALAWPERMESGVASLDLFARAHFDFEPPDERRFPCLRLARQALAQGGTATAILNAANEEAVAAFLERRAGYLQIPELIEMALEAVPSHPAASLDVILRDDASARDCVHRRLREAAA
ncbi:MAG TPA: 1-deoxy-D-xylulose-5-phosphate reductoisomerase [Gammaproteobacteria bacterium]|nr:1-deoxy-D-xylulose-5-phosphate reductoisomerase [Gammaproteobacteria bacterium]